MTRLPANRTPDALELFAALLIQLYRLSIETISSEPDCDSLLPDLQEVFDCIGDLSQPLHFTGRVTEPGGERRIQVEFILTDISEESP